MRKWGNREGREKSYLQWQRYPHFFLKILFKCYYFKIFSFIWLRREACRIVTTGAPGSPLMLTSAEGILEKLCVQKNLDSPPLDMQDGNFVHQLSYPVMGGTSEALIPIALVPVCAPGEASSEKCASLGFLASCFCPAPSRQSFPEETLS